MELLRLFLAQRYQRAIGKEDFEELECRVNGLTRRRTRTAIPLRSIAAGELGR